MLRLGKAVFTPDEIEVGSCTSFSLEFTVGDAPIAPRGGLWVRFLHRQSVDALQTDDAGQPDYISATTSVQGAKAAVSIERGPWMDISVRITGTRLAPGETITITFGDTSQGGPGFQVPEAALAHEVMVWVDPDGSGDALRLAESPTLRFAPGAAADLVALAPSQAVAGERFDLHVKAVDKFGNTASTYQGMVFFVSEECDVLPSDYTFCESDSGAHRFIAAAASANIGFNRITVKDREHHFSATTNPVEIVSKSPELRMCWGRIHGYSILSGGAPTPDEYYRRARDEDMLEVCALTDHDAAVHRPGRTVSAVPAPFYSGPAQAAAIQKYETNRFYRPGRFVTLAAYEWVPGEPLGRRRIYEGDDDHPPLSPRDWASGTPGKLYGLLRQRRAVVVTRPLPNEKVHDPEKDRLIEIYSSRGNIEFPGCPLPADEPATGSYVQEALAQGHRLGLVAGSDEGAPNPRKGATVFLAEDLTREAILEAMHARRCYATTGPRIFLDFMLNGFTMGEKITVTDPEESRVLSVRVAGTANIDHVDIVKNNNDLYRQDGAGPTAEFEYVDQMPASGTDFYYVRVTQSDDEMAWSSPIWVVAQERSS
ncbi:MAG: DUF3604 domain-containing protein [Planctomycetes bacterium]|nr:DUF3604 domain-containing protein [Planctomycetota bacterium]